ncbi:hypothetical protein GT347_05930 [Xylophilus rhododendri]|uniref:Tfp pilus assembly protein PilX n=1 Tax=Xylophilus rhododendri TaxID=2697032 RepID=A0A857J1I9_9BURK|nr:hypothetical protein [Xylophilus rhododendri]QHI97566.1 hypothetical protein GT347_05930 [Xylophilus rhododendri]
MNARRARRPGQRGFVLIVALVALVIMSLAAVALMRTVSTVTLVSGNLAYEQAAVTASDAGTEAAIVWIENNSGQASSSTATTCAATVGATVMACDQKARGYLASRTDPSSTQSWGDVWDALVSAGATPVAQAADAAGNTASYLVQRMCAGTGDASSAIGCSTAPASTACGSSMTLDSNAGAGNISCTSPTYYRITVKVAGPRGTTSYQQTMVAL